MRSLDLQPVVTEMVDKAMENPTKKKVRTCHQYHVPITDPLEHWKGCRGKGGLDAKHKDWAPCPGVQDSSEDDSDGSTLSQISLNNGDDNSDQIT